MKWTTHMFTLPPMETGDHRLHRLLAFADEILAVCDLLGIDPVLDGSLAVRAHTHDVGITVRDVDLSCPEADFSRLKRALDADGIACEIRDWHVLQARRDDLKVEFGANEVYMEDIDDPHDTVLLGSRTVRMVSRKTLRELYQRGLDATEGITEQRKKREDTVGKIRMLDSHEVRSHLAALLNPTSPSCPTRQIAPSPPK